MTFQDDWRENRMIEKFNLQKSPSRIGVDATYTLDGMSYEFELKSTSKNSISTARDVGLNHTRKWRKLIWICDIYRGDMPYSIIIPPDIMNPWIDNLEIKLLRYLEIHDRVITSLQNDPNNIPDIPIISSIIMRGSSINNPKIPLSITKSLPKIYQDHEKYLIKFLENKIGNGDRSE